MLAKYENPAVKSARIAKEDLLAELSYLKAAHEEMEQWDRQWAKITAEGPDHILAELAGTETNVSHTMNSTDIEFCTTDILGITQDSYGTL